MTKRTEIAKLYLQRQELISYLRMKADQQDWHGVSDAANDLRVLDAQITERKGPCNRST